MCQRAIIILLLASLALFSQAQRAQRGYTGSLSSKQAIKYLINSLAVRN
jgi:hypothetical protein